METARRHTILIADDEPDIVALLSDYLTSQGYDVLAAANGAEALALAERNPDLVILDVGMPGMDGYAVCRRLREHLNCPLMFLTARVEDADALEGFAAGADDYVQKPFSLAVLGARVAAHLSREGRQAVRTEVRFDGDVTIDYRTRTASVKEVPVELTPREFDIAAFLAKHPGQVFDRDRICQQAAGWGEYVSPAAVTEHVRRIRRKFAEAGAAHEVVETVWGVGYRWRP